MCFIVVEEPSGTQFTKVLGGAFRPVLSSSAGDAISRGRVAIFSWQAGVAAEAHGGDAEQPGGGGAVCISAGTISGVVLASFHIDACRNLGAFVEVGEAE